MLLLKGSILKSKFATSVMFFFPNLGNFGVALSVWDRMAGSFLHSTQTAFTFGIGPETKHYTRTFGHMYLLPFIRAAEMIWSWVIAKKMVFGGHSPLSKQDTIEEFKETREC